MRLQPTLTGPSLVVRPLQEADREPLFLVSSDPLIWEQHPADRHRRPEFDDFFDQTLASGGAVAVTQHDGTMVGASRYDGLDDDGSSVEIGWTFLARSHWGGPTNRELKQLMIDHAFAAGVQRIRFNVAPQNWRSQRAVLKLGARQVPSHRDDGYLSYELRREDCGS